jgi:hypothetical protein
MAEAPFYGVQNPAYRPVFFILSAGGGNDSATGFFVSEKHASGFLIPPIK